MKEEIKKEREIYVIGCPSIENLSKNELKAFYSTLLACVVDYYKEKTDKQKKTEAE